MVNIRQRGLDVLKNTHLMSLGVVDADGVWVADVIFIYDDDFNLYWLSAPDARHSKAVSYNPKVAATITNSTKSKEKNFCLQISGVAEKLEGVRFDLITKHWAKRSHPIPSVNQALQVLDGDCWYKMVPNKIELIDEENFGYDRQTIM